MPSIIKQQIIPEAGGNEGLFYPVNLPDFEKVDSYISKAEGNILYIQIMKDKSGKKLILAYNCYDDNGKAVNTFGLTHSKLPFTTDSFDLGDEGWIGFDGKNWKISTRTANKIITITYNDEKILSEISAKIFQDITNAGL